MQAHRTQEQQGGRGRSRGVLRDEQIPDLAAA
jgi:hypothetical protein